MIKVALPTVLAVQNTAGVHSENILVGLNTDRDWLFSNGSLQLSDGFWWDPGERLDANFTKRGLEFALAVFIWKDSRSVWVVRLELQEVGFEVLEGVLRSSSFATCRSGVT